MFSPYIILYMISESDVLKIVREIENLDIDVKATIEKTVTAGYLGEDEFYCTVMENDAFTLPVSQIFQDSYSHIELDNFYYDIISKALDDEGIYISLAYCSPDIILSPEYIDEVIEYDDYELESDELFYLREYALISADCLKVFKIYEEEGISGHTRTEDIGIVVRYSDGEYHSRLALRSTDLCMSSLRVFPLSEEYPMEHELSLLNPINKVLVEMIRDVIVVNL